MTYIGKPTNNELAADKSNEKKEDRMGLSEKFAEALRNAKDVASNSYLTFLSKSVEAVDQSEKTEILEGYIKKLEHLLHSPNFALDGNITNDFSQVLGEAHFLIMAAARGVTLQRISECSSKTPDFKFMSKEGDLFFEVKTLSVVDGGLGVKAALESSLAVANCKHRCQELQTSHFPDHIN